MSYWPSYWGNIQPNDGVINGANAYNWYNFWQEALWKQITAAGIRNVEIGDTFQVYDITFEVTAIQPSQILVQGTSLGTGEVFSIPNWPWASRGA